MNVFGKILVAFLTTASLAFVAFVFALLSGGPNWIAERNMLAGDFLFETTTGDVITHTVKDRVASQQIASSAVLPEVIVAARQRQVTDLRNQLQKASEEASRLQPLIEPIRDSIVKDKAGLELRRLALEQQLAGLDTQLQQTTTTLVDKTTLLQQTRLNEQERREEGLRLRTLLDMLRSDQYAAATQKLALADELVRLGQTRSRLRTRNEQLKVQLTY